MPAPFGDANPARIFANRLPTIFARMGLDDSPVDSRSRDEARELVVDRLIEGASLTMACRIKGMPSRRAVYRWMRDDKAFAERVTSAREFGVWTLLDALHDVATGGRLSTGNERSDALLCAILRWIITKRDPANSGAMRAKKGIEVSID